MLTMRMFSVIAMKSGTFPVSHAQLTSRCAGAGREHSQPKLGSGNIPCHGWHAQFVRVASRRVGILFLLFSFL